MQVASERRAVTVPEAAWTLGISVTTAWKLVYAGDIRAIRLGRAVRVPVEEVDRLLSGTPAEGVAVTAQ